jgi:hypothetical protein
MSAAPAIPCVSIPNLKPMTINLPFGGQLTSLVDISKGPPTDCTLVHGLMLQLGPALSGLECFLKLAKIISALSSVSPTNLGALADVANSALDFVQTCVPIPIKFACTILDVLKLLVAYLKCLITAVLSVLEFQAGIDLTAAQGNPVLLASLNCAQNNAAASMGQLKDAIAVVESLLSLIQPVLDIAASALPKPVKDGLKTITDIKSALESVVSAGGASVGVPGVQDIVQTLQNLKSQLEQLQGILDELPC